MVRTIFGTAVGIALGFALIFGNFGEMLIVALFGLIGYAVSKLLNSDVVDLSALVPRRQGEERRSSR